MEVYQYFSLTNNKAIAIIQYSAWRENNAYFFIRDYDHEG